MSLPFSYSVQPICTGLVTQAGPQKREDSRVRLGKLQKSNCFLKWNIRENLTKICKIKITDGRSGRRLKREGLYV